MFWKIIKPRSLILRLTLLYTTFILAILLIISAVLYVELEKDLKRNTKKLIQSAAVVFNQLTPHNKESILHHLHHEKEETIEDYWEILLITSFFGILSAGLSGLFLAYWSMRPIKHITRAIQKTTVTDLKTRLDVEQNWPKEFQQLSTHFNAMLDRLDIAFQHLSQFSADLAHELRTPINNLKGEAEICLMKKRSTKTYQRVIESSLEEYERLSQLIENILFLARTEDSKNPLMYEDIPLRKTIEKVMEYYVPMADEKNITLIFRGDENDYLTLHVDDFLFQRVLHNIFSNAVRYTLQGNITTEISLFPNQVHIKVIDTGIGVSPEHLPHLFERFYRADIARSHTSGGSGLGLAMVKSIIDLHHAKIAIESTLGHGTTVHLIFPL